MTSPTNDAALTPLDWIAAIVCCPLGGIVGIVYLIQGRPKASKMLLLSVLVFLLINAGILAATFLGNLGNR
jgi:hypothetical protein